MEGQNEYNSLCLADRFINGISNPGANSHVFGREPATNATNLKVSMQLFDKFAIVARITYEARPVFECCNMPCQCFSYKLIW